MALQAFRVLKGFGWNGWSFAPAGYCRCGCDGCLEVAGSDCKCADSDRCRCGIPNWRYGGDVWLVEEGHPRLDMMMAGRSAIGDASIGDPQELIKEEEFRRLLSPPKEPAYAGR